jgi:aminomethyltransferase
MLKRTPLFEAHRALGARLVEFGGWEMPVQYSGIVDEHLAVRRTGGLFDISHMGEVRLVGEAAGDFLNEVLTNDVRRLGAGQGQYTLLCNERGGVVDDLYAYCLAAREFLLVINASRIDADVAWLRQQFDRYPRRAGVVLENVSDFLGAVAVQGPCVAEFIDACFPGRTTGGTVVEKITELKKNQIAGLRREGALVWVARTGYTGEDGFEIIAPNAAILAIWNQLLGVGGARGLRPAGLGARDTLRTEMGYPLYGHELDESTTPLEAGLGFFVALDKGEFTGRPVLAEQKANGVRKKCVAFKMTDKAPPPRPHYPIWSPGAAAVKIGDVASGTQSPSLGTGIGMGYVPPEFSKPGSVVEIEIRGHRFAAAVAPKPLYRRPGA